MQDVNYWKYGCMEITLEVSCCKYPSSSTLETFWEENKNAVVEFLKQANTGLKGIVKFENGIPARNVTIKIDSREPYFKTNKNGEYYRLLLPGVYNLSILFDCNYIYNYRITIPNDSKLLVHNVTLSNELFSIYQNKKLDKYAVYCSKLSTANLNDFFLNRGNQKKLRFISLLVSFYYLVFI